MSAEGAVTTAARPPLRRSAGAGAGGGTIAQRVVRILALPAIVVLLLLGLVAAGQIQDLRSSQSTSRSVKLALAVQGLVHELQTERGLTAGVLGGNPSFRAELKPSRAAVNQQRAIVEGLVKGGSDVETQVGSALQQLDGLEAVRSATDAANAGRTATFAYFTDRIAALSSIDVGLDNTSDTELRQGVAALQALQDLTEATSQERAFLNGVFSAGGFGKGEFVQFASMRANKQAALNRFNRFATPSQRAAGNFVFGTGAAQETASFEQVAINAADGHHIVVNPQSWWSGLTTVLDDLSQLQDHVGSQIQLRAHDLQNDATRQLGLLLGGVVLCLAGSFYLAALASLSITRPLAALAAEADDVAAARLPEAVATAQADEQGVTPTPPAPVQVPPRATEEIRSVARALDRLQSAAYGLATEQAVQRRDTIESLANLGRRNQNLIRRQLGFITSLEREEIDPAALANLFELDHLATRMRRNAASLLVLVDASSPRQWSTSVPVADVIRAAVSEVEEYRRVALRRVDDTLVTGSAIGSIAHLLSELIENALTFSPPDTEVEVQGRRLGDGYLIAITDQGVGMTSEDLHQANSRLRGEGDFIAAPTRFLGHFVVGKLARDTSVNVELLPSPVTGVTARVTLPASLVSSPVDANAIESGSRARHADPAISPPPSQLTSQLLALPPLEEVSSPNADPWNYPGSRPITAPTPMIAPVPTMVSASASDALDPDRTPPSGIPRVHTGAIPVRTPAAGPGDANGSHGSNGSNGHSNGSNESNGSNGHSNGNGNGRSGPRRLAGDQPPSGTRQWTTASDLAGTQLPVSRPDRPSDFTIAPPAAGFGSIPPIGSFPSAPQAPAPSAAEARMDADRTRNGLRKRTPRTERAAEPTYARAPRRIDLDNVPARRVPPVVDHTPADVSARLTALRAGLHRGKGEQIVTGVRPISTGLIGTNEHEVEESE
jgi:signal transduction histidine kinase